MRDYLKTELEKLELSGLYKHERVMTSPQAAEIIIAPNQSVLNFCANNYLGLADHATLIATTKKAVEEYGFGLASVRFICGTQAIHKQLEKKISAFLSTEDTLLYSSCFDANGGLFETLLSEQDAIISDALNHASIIDGIRLCKAKRYRYRNNDMQDLETQLIAATNENARFIMIATDGVFSMDGIIANLPAICDLAEKYQALVMVDDSHAVGFMGKTGAGTPEYHGVSDRITLYTGTFGKALGGASGGYTSGPKEIIAWLRNRSRPYLFSNSLCPIVTAVTLEALTLLQTTGSELREKLQQNTHYFRTALNKAGFNIIAGEHPIVPILLGDAKLAALMAQKMLAKGIYVIGFSYPVVPLNQARIRVQLSAAHSTAQLDHAINAFLEVGHKMDIL